MSINTIVQGASQGINNAKEFLNNSANTLVRPKSAKGISGFLFDIPETENIELSSEITDHYTENNSYINDHEIKKPITITLSGFVGELIFRPPEGVEGSIQEIGNRLEVVDAYLGDLTPGFVQDIQKATNLAETAVSTLNQQLDRLQNVVGFFEGESVEETAQQKAFNNLYSLWQSATLLTVQTPWRYFENMRITNIGFSQDQETDQISNITVSLKELRFSEVETTDFDNYINTPREEVQKIPGEDIGKIQGRTESFLYSAKAALQ